MGMSVALVTASLDPSNGILCGSQASLRYNYGTRHLHWRRCIMRAVGDGVISASYWLCRRRQVLPLQLVPDS